MNVAPIAYAPSGRHHACIDGPELWVSDGADDVPRWKKFCEGILVGVGASDAEVAVVDSDGRLTVYRATDGLPERELPLDRACHGLAMAADGRLAVVVDDGVLLVDTAGNVRPIALPQAAAVAFAADGTLGIGTGTGSVVVVAPSGERVAECPVGGAVSGIAHALGLGWVAGAAARMHLVGPTKVQPPAQGDEPPPPPRTVWKLLHTWELDGRAGPVSVSGDGVVAAVHVGGGRIALFEIHGRASVGTLTADRDVGGLAFGPAGWLAVGYEGAEASRIDVYAGTTTQSQPGLGRHPGRWSVAVDIDLPLLRGAKASALAGGAAIAREIDRTPTLLPSVPTDASGKPRYLLYGGIGCTALGLFCGGSSCLTGLLYAIW